MFTFLDMINGSLGYFNMSVKVKNRIYTIIAALGDLYLVYVTFMLLKNHAWLRGLLYLLAIIAISYYVYLNAIYYFLDRTSKYDFISPKLTKLTGFTPETPEAKDAKRRERHEQLANYRQSNGIYANEDVINTEVTISPNQQANLRAVTDELVSQQLLKVNYNGFTDAEITEEYQTTGKPVDALDRGQQPPFFELRGTQVWIGVNQMTAQPVATLTKVGLTPVQTAMQQYQIYLANVYLTGGPHKVPGRSGNAILTDADFGLVVQVAYQARNN